MSVLIAASASAPLRAIWMTSLEAGGSEVGGRSSGLATGSWPRASPATSTSHRGSVRSHPIRPRSAECSAACCLTSVTRARLAARASARRDRGSSTASSVLSCSGVLDLAVGGDEHGGVGLGLEAGVLTRHVVGDDQVDLLGGELLAGARARVAGLGGEADQHRRAAAGARLAELGEDVGRARRTSSSAARRSCRSCARRRPPPACSRRPRPPSPPHPPRSRAAPWRAPSRRRCARVPAARRPARRASSAR